MAGFSMVIYPGTIRKKIIWCKSKLYRCSTHFPASPTSVCVRRGGDVLTNLRGRQGRLGDKPKQGGVIDIPNQNALKKNPNLPQKGAWIIRKTHGFSGVNKLLVSGDVYETNPSSRQYFSGQIWDKSLQIH